ncbi:response regulator [bacterium]|nr:MAG: response regulator [bacterium]
MFPNRGARSESTNLLRKPCRPGSPNRSKLGRRPRGRVEELHLTRTILIVDDEPELRKLVRAALEKDGHRVLEAGDEAEALRLVRSEKVDLTLIDWILPGKSGLELQNEILADDSAARTVLITGFGTIETALRCIKSGARDFLRKPFTPEALRATVAATLAREGRDAPVATVRREFVRTNVNGYAFELDRVETDPPMGDIRCCFNVLDREGANADVEVVLPAYVQELAKALIDVETLPCGERFWTKMCEEELARYLWHHDGPPTDGTLRIEDIAPGQREWLESVTTVLHAEPASNATAPELARHG